MPSDLAAVITQLQTSVAQLVTELNARTNDIRNAVSITAGGVQPTALDPLLVSLQQLSDTVTNANASLVATSNQGLAAPTSGVTPAPAPVTTGTTTTTTTTTPVTTGTTTTTP